MLQWFRSYLTDCCQRVTVLGASSETLPSTLGVPQGSILGPALFLLYVSILPDSVVTSHIAMFADVFDLKYLKYEPLETRRDQHLLRLVKRYLKKRCPQMFMIITLHEGRVKYCIEFLIFFRRVTFVQPRTQAHFTADDAIISLAAAPKFVSCACACGFTDHQGEKVFCFGKEIFLIAISRKECRLLS